MDCAVFGLWLDPFVLSICKDSASQPRFSNTATPFQCLENKPYWYIGGTNCNLISSILKEEFGPIPSMLLQFLKREQGKKQKNVFAFPKARSQLRGKIPSWHTPSTRHFNWIQLLILVFLQLISELYVKTHLRTHHRLHIYTHTLKIKTGSALNNLYPQIRCVHCPC